MKSYFIGLPLRVPFSPYRMKAHGYSGSAGVPQVRCCHTQLSSSYSKVAVCVSAMLDLPPFWTYIPPEALIRLGQPRSNIQRTVSNMWMHMSPVMPLPYSIIALQPRCGRPVKGSNGAGPDHISRSE